MLKIKQKNIEKMIKEAIENEDEDETKTINFNIRKRIDFDDMYEEGSPFSFLYHAYEIFDPHEQVMSKNDWEIFQSATVPAGIHSSKFKENHNQVFIIGYGKIVYRKTNNHIYFVLNSIGLERNAKQYISSDKIIRYRFKNGINITKLIKNFEEKREKLINAISENLYKTVGTDGNGKPVYSLWPKIGTALDDLIGEDVLTPEFIEQALSGDEDEFMQQYFEHAFENIAPEAMCLFSQKFWEIEDIQEFHDLMVSLDFKPAVEDDLRSASDNKYENDVGIAFEVQYDWNSPAPPPSKDPRKPNLSIGTVKDGIIYLDITQLYYSKKIANIIVEISKFYDIGD